MYSTVGCAAGIRFHEVSADRNTQLSFTRMTQTHTIHHMRRPCTPQQRFARYLYLNLSLFLRRAEGAMANVPACIWRNIVDMVSHDTDMLLLYLLQLRYFTKDELQAIIGTACSGDVFHKGHSALRCTWCHRLWQFGGLAPPLCPVDIVSTPALHKDIFGEGTLTSANMHRVAFGALLYNGRHCWLDKTRALNIAVKAYEYRQAHQVAKSTQAAKALANYRIACDRRPAPYTIAELRGSTVWLMPVSFHQPRRHALYYNARYIQLREIAGVYKSAAVAFVVVDGDGEHFRCVRTDCVFEPDEHNRDARARVHERLAIDLPITYRGAATAPARRPPYRMILHVRPCGGAYAFYFTITSSCGMAVHDYEPCSVVFSPSPPREVPTVMRPTPSRVKRSPMVASKRRRMQ